MTMTDTKGDPLYSAESITILEGLEAIRGRPARDIGDTDMRGLHHHNERTQIYISCGTNHWGPPMRLGAAPEITHLSLHARSAG